MSNYYSWKEFEHTYLEDSFVRAIEETDDQLIFFIEIVLLKAHPMYTKPLKNEQHCYKNAKIIFRDISSIDWIERNNTPFIDANNEEDFGNIDSFEYSSKGYHLTGDWGEAIINSAPPGLVWIS